ncbi:MAG: sulfatase [Kiritimatiellaeota bacterium]|nr:sulfatase [Kiritimatiellota bacterium]
MNVIYIVCHDLGRQLGCYGRGVRSPNLDRLAAEGVRFDKAFTSSAVCSPARGCAMTGMHAHSNGILGLTHMGWRYYPQTKTIVDHFNGAGYTTIHCGLSHEGEEWNSRYQYDFENSWDAELAEHAVDQAVAMLKAERVKKNNGNTTPFYLNVGFRETHAGTFQPDFNYEGFPGRVHQKYGGPVPDHEGRLPGFVAGKPQIREAFAKFPAAIKYMDAQVGRLLRAIEAFGFAEDSLVVFTTDHGMRGMRTKCTMYDAGLETALLMRLPAGMKNGWECGHLIQNIDYVPTLLDACGIAVPPCVQGRSFWNLLCGKTYTPHDILFSEWNCLAGPESYRPVRAARTGRHHCLVNFDPVNSRHYWKKHEITDDMVGNDPRDWPWPALTEPHGERLELYDVVDDPLEYRNLAHDETHRETLVGLVDRIYANIRDTGDFVLDGKCPPMPCAAAHPEWS